MCGAIDVWIVQHSAETVDRELHPGTQLAPHWPETKGVAVLGDAEFGENAGPSQCDSAVRGD